MKNTVDVVLDGNFFFFLSTENSNNACFIGKAKSIIIVKAPQSYI